MSVPKTASQMRAEHAVWLDDQPMTVSCSLPGCRWKYTGPAATARDQSAAHRSEKHSDLKPRSLAQIVKEQKRQAQKPPPIPKAPPTPKERKEPMSRPPTWTVEKAIAAVQAYAKKRGHPPTCADARLDPDLPAPPTAKRLCGSWANLIEQAGFERPHKGKRSRPRPALPDPDRAAVDQRVRGDEPTPCPRLLIAFLYLLLRDELPAGAVHTLVTEAEKLRRPKFSNEHLGEYAAELASRLLQSPA